MYMYQSCFYYYYNILVVSLKVYNDSWIAHITIKDNLLVSSLLLLYFRISQIILCFVKSGRQV